MNTKKRVIVGLVDFIEPTLLLAGSGSDLHSLANLFESGNPISHLNAGTLLTPIGIELNLYLDSAQTQMIKKGNQIDWFISLVDAKIYAELIRAVAKSEKPSHTYLDVPVNEELEIIVSKDEYDRATVFIK